jgi:DNA-binding NarL/FixJ family response regulator
MQSRTLRLEAALRASADWQTAETIDELARRASDALLDLIPADGSGWNEIGLRTGALRVLASPSDYFPDHHEDLAELIHENPLVGEWSRTGGAAFTISDLIGVREYHRRQIYNDVYRPQGVEDQLGAAIQVDGDAMVAVALNRPRRSFTHLDRTLLELLRGHLVSAYRTVVERGHARARVAALDRGLEAAGAGIVVLTRDGKPVDASDHARALMVAWFGSDVPAPGRYEREDATLSVRRVDGDPALLLLDERRSRPDAARIRTLGLTRREVTVVTLAGKGLSNRAIADELFLSPRTVQKHLERAFAKLGAINRTDAARRLLDL